MRSAIRTSVLLAGVFIAGSAWADSFSNSALSPSPVPASGVIAGSYPAGGGETSYYFAADLKAGDLASQISYSGAPDSSKMIELDLLDPSGRSIDSYYIKSFGQNAEDTRVFKVANSGKHTLRVTLKGPESAAFRVDLGGSSLAVVNANSSNTNSANAATAVGAAYSTSFLAPSKLPVNGVIAGTIPPGAGAATSYYFASNLQAGDLITQIGISGAGATSDMIELALLNPEGNAIDQYYTKSFEPNHEATRQFKIDRSGRYVLRVTVQGAETSGFKAEVGGSALVLTQ